MSVTVNLKTYRCKGAKVIDSKPNNIEDDDTVPTCNVHGRLSKIWTLKLNDVYVTCYICVRNTYRDWYHCNKLCSGNIHTTELYSIGYSFRYSIDDSEEVLGHKIQWEDVELPKPSYYNDLYHGRTIVVDDKEVHSDDVYEALNHYSTLKYILYKDTKGIHSQHPMDKQYGYIVMNDDWSDIWADRNGANIGISKNYVMEIFL